MQLPHRLDADEIRPLLQERDTLIAYSRTADRAQVKRLMQVDQAYHVQCMSLSRGGGTQTIYTGTLAGAVRVYNRLS